MKIEKTKSVGLIIDVQERLMPHIHDHETLDKNIVKLIEGLKILDVPLLVSQQYTKGLGPTIESVGEMLGNYRPVEKTEFSCCGNEDFMNELNKMPDAKFVISCGIESHVCVQQTVIGLLTQNPAYIPVVVEDCIGSRNPNDKRVAVERMRQAGAIITTLESLLFELLEQAGSEVFKKISRLVK